MFHWDDAPDLNITPLMDIMLVLMAVLMIVAPTVTYQEEITLPSGSKSQKLDKPKKLTIRMDGNKNVYLNNDTYSLDTFGDDFLNLANTLDKSSTIYIKAEEKLPYKYVMQLLTSIKAAGFSKVSLLSL